MSCEISVIIVSYNAAAHLQRCLDSVCQQRDVSFEIIVIDNASSDASRAVLHSYGNKIITLLSPKNLGFGKANNKAAQIAQGRYLYLLNPDTELQSANTLSTFFACAQAHPQIALFGSQILRPNNTPSLPYYHYRHEKYMCCDVAALPGKIAWLIGASLFIVKQRFQDIGGFDEAFFLYGEETDLCLRLRQAGAELGYCSEVIVHHIGGYSEANNHCYDVSLRKQQALHLFYEKHLCAEILPYLLQKELWIARLRALSYRLRLLFHHSSAMQNRYSHYQAVIDSSQQKLQQLSKQCH